MIKIYRCGKNEIENTLKNAVPPYICGIFEIKRTANGKPYIEGNPVYFSLSHSGNKAVVAICDKPVGVDCEIIRERKIKGVLSRFTERERDEINVDTVRFLYNWTAKEAFIKMKGGTLANDLKRLEYCESKLYAGGKLQNCTLETQTIGNLIITVCTER